jgi:hypothetical protein
MQEVTKRYSTKHSEGGCPEPTRRMIFASSIEEDIIQLMGILWFQIPFKDLHLYAAKMPDMLQIRFKVRWIDQDQIPASHIHRKSRPITSAGIPE